MHEFLIWVYKTGGCRHYGVPAGDVQWDRTDGRHVRAEAAWTGRKEQDEGWVYKLLATDAEASLRQYLL